MVKLIESSQFADVPEIGAKLAEYRSPAMAKEAENVFGRSYASLKPTDDRYVGIHLTALGDEETYGCFFAGAPVLTPSGLRPIEEIKAGDEVVTHSGKVAKVARTFASHYSGQKADVRITAMPDPVSCTADHPFLVVRRDGLGPSARFRLRKEGRLAEEVERRVSGAEWVRADELAEGDYLVVPTEYAPEALVQYGVPAEFDPYACGYYLAAGRLVGTAPSFSAVALTGQSDRAPAFDRIDAWRRAIGKTVPERRRGHSDDSAIGCVIECPEFAAWLASAFGPDRWAHRVSPAVWQWPATARMRLLAGYFDGCGRIAGSAGSRYYGSVAANTASRSLAMDLQRLMASVGIASSVSRVSGWAPDCAACSGGGAVYEIGVGAWQARALLEHTARLQPVRREFRNSGASSMQIGRGHALVRIAGVEISEVEDVKYNLEVPGDNSYVVDVAVHNCNRNMDAFPKEACVKYHDTFVRHGHVFSHHHNDATHDEILGMIKASAFNEPMGRVELFIWADKEKAREGLDTLEKTGECSFSMACFRAGTPVLVSGGLKPIEAVRPGDVVLTHAGNWRRVEAAMSKEADGYCRVSFAGWGDRVLEATPNHRVLASRSGGQPEWTEVAALTEHDFMCVPAAKPVSGIKGEDDLALARLFGYYMGVGRVVGKHAGTASVCFARVPGFDASELAGLSDWDEVRERSRDFGGSRAEIVCRGKVVGRLVSECGRLPERRGIPAAVMGGSRAVRTGFAAALFGCSGWSDGAGVHWGIRQSGPALELQVLLASLGIPSDCGKGPVPTGGHANIVSISAADGVSLGLDAAASDWAPATSVADGWLRVPVASVERVDMDTRVYNLSVDGDESYTAFGLAVHNCKVAFDVCSICGARRSGSHDPNMCDHIRHQLGKVAENGKVAYMRNTEPDFFDISFVTRPADRIAYSLKVASGEVVTSEMLARAAGVVEPGFLTPGLAADKREVLRKLAEQYDEYDRDPRARALFAPVAKAAESAFDDRTVDVLRRMPVKEAMAFLADRGAFMGPDAFCKYAMGPGSSEYAAVGRFADAVGSLASQAVKEAAWLDRFDLASPGVFDCDRFTSRPSRRFQEVAEAAEAVKAASFTDGANVGRLVADRGPSEKRAAARVDGGREICFNSISKPVLAVALKYAEYKVSALNAALNGATDAGWRSQYGSRDSLLALVAAQDL